MKLSPREILTKWQINITQNRLKIIECLQDGTHFHTIADILDHTKTLNTKSVYNSIKHLIDKGVVDTYSFGGSSQYALSDNLVGDPQEIHIFRHANEVSHTVINKTIFKAISDELSAKGLEAVSIKIFVKVK